MADDILDTLLAHRGGTDESCAKQLCVLCQAADLILVQECEIERLRAKVVHLSAWFSFCDHPIECDVCGDVYRSEEARRG